MKALLFLPLLIWSSGPITRSGGNNDENGKIVVDNDQVKVVEFVGTPQGKYAARACISMKRI